MFTTRRLIIVATAVALLSGCASPNPYDNQGQADGGSQGMSKTAKYGGLGALAGALAGAAIDHNNRGKGALIGAAVVGASAAGYGYYADQQEKKLRASMANTGVEVQRQGDQIKLIMPGNITFATDSANIAAKLLSAAEQPGGLAERVQPEPDRNRRLHRQHRQPPAQHGPVPASCAERGDLPDLARCQRCQPVGPWRRSG